MILPLDQIGKEQVEYIKRIWGRPRFLNADTISDKLLEEVGDAKYREVWTGFATKRSAMHLTQLAND